jgi:hypothetical protein
MSGIYYYLDREGARADLTEDVQAGAGSVGRNVAAMV